MANLKLLQEAIQAFANGEQEVADTKMRQYFIEAASDINKKLEEEMEDETDETDDEVMEDFSMSPSQDLNTDVQYPMEEAEEEPTDVEVDFQADDEGADDSAEAELPSADQWADIQDAYRGLQKMFDEIAGDEKVGESYKMKDAPSVDKTEKPGVNKKSPIASTAKSPVQGVEPIKTGKNTTPVVDDTFDGADAESFTIPRDNDNVLNKATDSMKDAKQPKNTATKASSVLPKKAPKL